jgi:CRISPR/Cas system-associated exonuclease Cas4 (RecB family)
VIDFLNENFEFSEKQVALIDYLLTRLGFEDNSFTRDYVIRLTSVAYIHRNVRAIYGEIESDDQIPDFYYFDGEKCLPEKYDLIDFLIDEYKLKKEKKYEILRNISEYVSATDLANFTFCPIGYAIDKSFEIETNSLTETGEHLHEQSRLSSRIDLMDGELKKKLVQRKDNVESYITEENHLFFDKIMESKLLYSGHSESTRKYFTNEQIKFIGQPDYIFKDNSGVNFIVEEKFKRERYRGFDSFFSNHKIQLASYIYYLNEFNAQYGYLVYWMYDYSGYEISYERCLVTRIDRGTNMEQFLIRVHNELRDFKRKKFLNPDLSRLDGKKCASCVYCRYCGHKNGKKSQVTLPYQRSYHNLYKAEYPQILNDDKGL